MRQPYRPQLARPRFRPKLEGPFAEFLRSEANSGAVLMLATVAALVWANSPYAETYFSLWHTTVSIGIGDFVGRMSLHHVVNDGLMALFFLLVGLEIKREILLGQLSSWRRASLPVVAALGGMVVPAAIYFTFNVGQASVRGWGVPMATDIAFALGVMLLLGSRVPYALKVFLVAVAIADDIGAVLVIAIFYSGDLNWFAMTSAGGFLAALALVNWVVVRTPLVYMVLGLGLWISVLQSGVHATVAGVLLAFMVPARVFMKPFEFIGRARGALEAFERSSRSAHSLMTEDMQVAVRDLERASQRVQMPLERVEDGLGPWVRYAIMPLFAFANAGVALGGGVTEAIGGSIGLGVITGLVLGKPLGIVLFSWISVRARLADLPAGVAWMHIVGAGFIAGIGFTMSLFVAELAFVGNVDALRASKIAILTASIIAGTTGLLVLRAGPRGKRAALRAVRLKPEKTPVQI